MPSEPLIGGAAAAPVKDVTTANFMAEVVDGSFDAPVIVDFLARYPEASVDLRTGHAMIDLVQEAFDLAISAQPTPDSTLVRRHLATLSLMLCGAPAYFKKHSAPQSPADLASHNCLRYPYAPFEDGWRFLDAGGNPVTARISGSLISSSPETTRAAAVAGIGLMITAPFLIEDLLASGALVPLLPGYRAQQCEINAFYPHRRHLAAKVRAFIDMLVDRFAEQQRWLDAKAEQ